MSHQTRFLLKPKEEEAKAGKEKYWMYKAVEAYLRQNPDAYA